MLYKTCFPLVLRIFVPVIKIWIKKCSGFVSWCHLITLDVTWRYVVASLTFRPLSHILQVMWSVYVWKGFGCAHAYLNWYFRPARIYSSRPVQKKSRALQWPSRISAKCVFCCCCKLQQVLELTNPGNCSIFIKFLPFPVLYSDLIKKV